MTNEDTINGSVLVLNKYWQPIEIASMCKALCHMVTGEARVVHRHDNNNWETFEFANWCDFGQVHNNLPAVHTTRLAVPKPTIILLSECEHIKQRTRVPFSRNNIYLRDQNTCQYCGQKFDRNHLNLDHVYPRKLGGISSWTNIVCSCIPCNTKKADRTPEQAGMRLINKPKEPTIYAVQVEHQEWRDFLSQSYWCVPLEQ